MTDPVTSSGVAMDPRMNPAEDGSDHSPASRGDSPRTSCRYWAVNNSAPKPTKKLSRLVVETRA
jgi:hypothetical protein